MCILCIQFPLGTKNYLIYPLILSLSLYYIYFKNNLKVMSKCRRKVHMHGVDLKHALCKNDAFVAAKHLILGESQFKV